MVVTASALEILFEANNEAADAAVACASANPVMAAPNSMPGAPNHAFNAPDITNTKLTSAANPAAVLRSNARPLSSACGDEATGALRNKNISPKSEAANPPRLNGTASGASSAGCTVKITIVI